MKQTLTIILFATLLIACKRSESVVKTVDTIELNSPKKYPEIETLLAKMTLDEKIGQMNQYNGFWDLTGPAPALGDGAMKYEHLRSGLVGSMLNVKGVKDVLKVQKIAVEETRLGIPLIFGFDVIHGYKTLAPIPLAEAASWDLEAIRISASVGAKEATASGLNWTFAPMMDISRDARWGRVMEGAGEDTYLGTKIAVARVKGFQGDDLSDPYTVAACAKHFAGYGFAEAGRDYNTVDVGTSTLHNVILPPFKACSDAGVATFMNSFNELNGIPATANAYLQRDILKNKWGFEGFVVSDWGSIAEIVTHGNAENPGEATIKAVNAGSDMDMESYFYVNQLKKLVETGVVNESKITDAARRILNIKYELGLFDDPYKYCNEEREKEVLYSQDLRNKVLDVAKKSIVLLKNDKNLLPLKNDQKVAVIGPLADDNNSPLGGWRIASDNNTAVSVKEGLSKYKQIQWSFHQGVKLNSQPTNFVFESRINETDRTGIDEAVNAAKSADVVVMVLGELGFQSGEGRSRSNPVLPGLQQELLEAVHGVNPNIVLVVMSGRPLILSWADENIPSIVEAWQLGTETGNAIAQTLMGDNIPSGKLPMTFPRNVGQIPIYYNYKNTGRPSILPDTNLVFWSHYSDIENSPLYPFGHGLSYTTFEYSSLNVSKSIDNNINVDVLVKNTGDYDAEEVVQLYIRDHVASVTRPVKELKGFEKLLIKKGESATVKFVLTDQELGFFDNQGEFLVEPGKFTIMVGGSSDTHLAEDIIR